MLRIKDQHGWPGSNVDQQKKYSSDNNGNTQVNQPGMKGYRRKNRGGETTQLQHSISDNYNIYFFNIPRRENVSIDAITVDGHNVQAPGAIGNSIQAKTVHETNDLGRISHDSPKKENAHLPSETGTRERS